MIIIDALRFGFSLRHAFIFFHFPLSLHFSSFSFDIAFCIYASLFSFSSP